jgi:hypothetical protein
MMVNHVLLPPGYLGAGLICLLVVVLFLLVKKPEKFFFVLLFGSVFPMLFFMLSWWMTYFLWRIQVIKSEGVFLYAMTGGFLLGILADGIASKRIRSFPFGFRRSVLCLIYLFYSICLFGFFMGFPCFNLFLGLIAGYYSSRRLVYEQANDMTIKKEIHKISLFTAWMMGIICMLTAFVALLDISSTIQTLKMILHLSIEVTLPMIIGSILIGGFLLVILQYWLTRITMVKTLKNNRDAIYS